ncbi:MAG: MerR family transcriptional regulator [Clostridiales bacterium]|nr:MerR family transcriptional regulator [Clostridiales bacterium]
MLKIGDFSKLSRITIRMLRHYDEIDLLTPQTVDEWTGYRYYDEAQLLTANKIQLLKNLGFGLSAIKEVLTNFNDYTEIEKLLKIRQAELVSEEAELRERIRYIDSAIKILKQEGSFMNYVVNLKTIPELYVASVRKVIANYMAEGELWSLLMPEVGKQKCKATTPCYAMSVYHDKGFVESNADVEVRFAVDGNYNDAGEIKFKKIPAVEVAACTFKGGYEQITAVNEAIAKWANENGYEFCGAVFWIYHKSPYETKNPEDYVTEICFPVKKK